MLGDVSEAVGGGEGLPFALPGSEQDQPRAPVTKGLATDTQVVQSQLLVQVFVRVDPTCGP